MSKKHFFAISVVKCPPIAPSCNYFITFCASMVDRHRLNLLSHPILYKTSLFIVKGLTLLTNYCFCHVDKNSSICHVYKKILASFSHSSSMKNKLASMVYSRVLVGFVVSCNLYKHLQLHESCLACIL
jgi:hypothetical protein